MLHAVGKLEIRKEKVENVDATVEIRESTDFRNPNSLADSGRAIRVQKICVICGEHSVCKAQRQSAVGPTAQKRSLREKEIRGSTDFRNPNSLADSGRAIRVQKICVICGEHSVCKAQRQSAVGPTARKRSLRQKEIRCSTEFRNPNALADSGRAIRVQKIRVI